MTTKSLAALVIGALAAAVQSLLGASITPETVEGKTNEVGATSHDSIRCVMWNHWEPQNLVSCYFQVCGPLQQDISAHLITQSGTNTIVSAHIGAMSTNNSKTLYNFVMRRDLVKDSYIDGYCARGYFRLKLGTVPILTKEEYERMDHSKALRCLPSATTNRLGHVASFSVYDRLFVLSKQNPQDESLEIRLVAIAVDGNTTLERIPTGEILRAMPGDCFFANQGRLKLVSASASKGEARLSWSSR